MPNAAAKISETAIAAVPPELADATPMMQQYWAIKQAHQDYLLFYRMGDFYELFFEDALVASRALDITLTRRGQHEGADIPMCGVPVHSHEQYLERLTKHGFKVAICEQMEDPKEAKKRGHKAVVKREVIRIITPGTLTEDSLLEAAQANYLAAVHVLGEQVALAWVDISTGELMTTLVDGTLAGSELARIMPRELLISDKLRAQKEHYVFLAAYESQLTSYVHSLFDAAKGERILKELFSAQVLDGFGQFSLPELAALAALLEYVRLTQVGKIPQLSAPKRHAIQQAMVLDAATRTNLELLRTTQGEVKGSVYGIINECITAPGQRLLQQHLGAPLLDCAAINARLDRVEYFVAQPLLRQQLRVALKRLPDIPRILSRVSLHRASPRDMLALREGLLSSIEISELLEVSEVETNMHWRIHAHDGLREELIAALQDAVPIQARDGGFIKAGYDPKLDGYRNAEATADEQIEQLRLRYVQESGIDKLKIKENNVLGYFIEITPQHLSKIPPHFVHRQTLAGAVRFTTDALRAIEHELLHAKTYALDLELQLFTQLLERIREDALLLAETAQTLAELDVALSHAQCAEERNYTRPVFSDAKAFSVTQGRHPVVEAQPGVSFIANDCNLAEVQRLWLMTGPNMAGKSTFLRQNALMAILAQAGAYVPAQAAHIDIVDRVFSRVGAADDLARGRSTFMVEMVETATILHQATERSLVILDEIGRGTATYDGLAIAWAVLEHLHSTTRCRTIFATHYHELTALRDQLPQLACYTMKVQEWKDSIVFLHEVQEGMADRSYGVHVAKLAGLPKAVTQRAQYILQLLQQHGAQGVLQQQSPQFSFFAAPAAVATEPEPAEEPAALQALRALNPDALSPREALDALYQLKEKL